MSFLAAFGRAVGVSIDNAEAALYSERGAHVALSRRSLLAAGSAMATAAMFSFPIPYSPDAVVLPTASVPGQIFILDTRSNNTPIVYAPGGAKLLAPAAMAMRYFFIAPAQGDDWVLMSSLMLA